MSSKLVTRMGIGFVIIILVLIGLAWVLMSSLWFYWHSLPDNGFRLAVNTQSIPAEVKKDVLSHLTPDIYPYIDDFYRLAVSRGVNTTIIVGLPKMQNQLGIDRDLKRAGWQVERLGPIIRARSSSGAVFSSTKKALIKDFFSLFTCWSPYPSFLIQTTDGDVPLVHQPAFAIGVANGQNIKLIIGLNESAAAQKDINLPSPVMANVGRIHIPGQIISIMPEQILTDWNSLLSNQLGLAEVKPDITGELKEHQQITVLVSGKDVAMRIEGQTASFLAKITEWLTQVDQRQRLARRSFKLPDGKIAYEKVPGAPRLVMNGSLMREQCTDSINGLPRIWMCTAGEVATVATREDLARQELLDVSQNSFVVDLPASMLSGLSDMWPIMNLHAFGQMDRIAVSLTLRK